MKRTASEMRGLQRTRDDIAGLTGKLEAQKKALSDVRGKLEQQKAAYAALDQRMESAREKVKQATEAHARHREELGRERAAIEASRRPTEEQIARLERLRNGLKEARDAKAAADRMLRGAEGALEGKRQFLAVTHSRIGTLEATRSAAIKGGAPEAEIQRITAALEKEKLKARELSDAMHIYEAEARRAAAAAAEAAARLDEMNRQLSEQKKLMSGMPTEEETAKLEALERQVHDSGRAMAEAKKEEKEATDAHRAHAKAASQAGESLEQLEKKERDHAASVAGTEHHIERAREASNRYSSSLQKQGLSVEDLTDAQRRHNQAIERQQYLARRQEELNRLRDRARDLRSQAMSHLYFTLGSGYLFTAPLRHALEFEKAMVRVKAMSGANSEEYRRLKDEARRLGSETIFTAKEVAEAYNELATAGYRTNDMIAIMPSMLALSESSMTSLARTAEITSEVLQGFRIDVSEMARVGDALTAAYSSSASSLESLGEMLKYAAAPAVDVGSSLEQTLAASSILHNTGIKGSMAGTSMRAIFLRMAKPPKELKRILDAMDISTVDKDNNVRNWMDVLSDINLRLKGAGSAKRAAVSKALGGEEHAPAASNLLAAVDSGALRFMERTLKLAGPFNLMAKRLLSMPDQDLKKASDSLGVKLNKAMSGGGMALAFAESLKGLKGEVFERQMGRIFSELNLTPTLEDIRPDEFVGTGKKVDDALKSLQISRTKPLGGTKTSEELTSEIKTRIQMLPMSEQLRFIEIFFLRTRSGVRELFMEFQKGGKNADQLIKALDEILNMEKAKKGLSESTINDLKKVESAWDDIKISLGNSLIPLLKDLLVTIQPIIDGLGKWLRENQTMAKNIMLGVGSLFAFSAAMAAAKFALSGFVDLWRVGKWGAGLFGPGTRGRRGFGWLRTGAGIGKNFLVEGLVKSGSLARSSLGVIMNAARAAGAALLAMGPAGWAVAAAVAAVAAAGIYLWRNWDEIGPKLKKTWADLKAWFQNLWTSIANTAGAAWGWIGEKLSMDPVAWVKEKWERFLDFFKGIYARIRPYISGIFPWMENVGSDIKGFLSDAATAGKSTLQGMFDYSGFKYEAPPSHAIEKAAGAAAPITQRNVITVNATIHVEAGPAAPAQVASRIKGEIQSAFRNVPSFSFLDPVVVS
ncbi:phage tail tape measure protein [Oligoflexus tunisiensis]|uniref:phage tail tape measure protein n=1 Tax=Oligoflexus tunisiensis TaxID=708132 RepID=UPI00159F0917|nr:phage tail tape measure protein [Oligoflexus tunisiensis]